MSKPIVPGELIVRRSPIEQVRYFAERYRARINPAAHAYLQARVRELGLDFSEDELTILAALYTPERVQAFLNSEIYYNNDHEGEAVEETAMPPRRVLQTGMAHCFEGALFAYAVNYLHGHWTRLLLLEASQDSDHNLILYEGGRNKLFGAVAHSRYPKLDGRRPQYVSLRGLAESYYPYYYSDRTGNPEDLTLVGFSEPVDLVFKYGVRWMDSLDAMWDIYFTYIDDTVPFQYLFDYGSPPHQYPLVNALEKKWIRLTEAGTRAFVSPEDLPRPAQELWYAFWRIYDPRDPRPLGAARAFEKQFFDLTGTTPIDLQDLAADFYFFLARGYRVEQLLTRPA